MPKKGSARATFEGLQEVSAHRRAPPCRYDEEDNRLEFRFVPKLEADGVWIDCSPLLVLSEDMAIGFAAALSIVCTGLRRASARAHVYNLKNGFVKFCLEKKSKTIESEGIESLDTTFINEFIAWLSRLKSDGSFELSYYTRRHLLGSVEAVLDGMRQLKLSLPNDCEVQPNPWPLGARTEQSRSQDPLSVTEAIRFYSYVKRCVQSIIEDVESLWEMEADFETASSTSPKKAHGLLGSIISDAKKSFGVDIPERRELKEDNHPLFERIEKFGYRRLMRAFGPYASDLCPFIYYFFFTTRFNLQGILDLETDNIQLKRVLDRDVVLVRTRKNRSTSAKYPNGKSLQESFVLGEDRTSPAAVLRFLVRWTAHLRANIAGPTGKYLLLFISRDRSKKDKSFSTYALLGRGRSIEFDPLATNFCKRGGFEWIGSRRIRNVIAEMAHDVLGGDIRLVGQLLHHSLPETTRNHYQNANVRAFQVTQLAKGMQQRERWAISKGKIEPRNVDKHHDRSAATPGFRCVDPTDSPIPGQEAGRLCTAYGSCPACPLAMIDLKNVYAAACCAELKTLMDQERLNLGQQVFDMRRGSSYHALTEIFLPAFPSSIRAQAAQLDMPSLPDLE